MLAGLSLRAFAADSSVTYEGQAEKFVFVPKNTDLFQNFKDVMPGDVLTQTITVKNEASCKVKLYLRAETVDEKYQDFLSQLRLTVTQQNGSDLFEASADEKDGLKENVCLGTLSPGANEKITVKLEVPVTLGDEYQNKAGEIHWVFTIEEHPGNPNPAPVKTGDSSRPFLYMGIVTVSIALALVLATGARRKKDR
jgi:hypothetical protein